MQWLGHQIGGTRLGAAVRVAASVLLLLAIASDLVADTRCNSVPPQASSQGTFLKEQLAGTQGTGDPCGDFCGPDCFCCSHLVAGVPAVAFPAVRCPLAIAAAAAERWLTGVRPVPYHPPLLTT